MTLNVIQFQSVIKNKAKCVPIAWNSLIRRPMAIGNQQALNKEKIKKYIEQIIKVDACL